MANDGRWSSWDDSEDFYSDTPEVKDLLWGPDYIKDERAEHLFFEAFFDKNDAAYIDLVEYMWDQYGIDFEEAFDWADFREWYESQ